MALGDAIAPAWRFRGEAELGEKKAASMPIVIDVAAFPDVGMGIIAEGDDASSVPPEPPPPPLVPLAFLLSLLSSRFVSLSNICLFFSSFARFFSSFPLIPWRYA